MAYRNGANGGPPATVAFVYGSLDLYSSVLRAAFHLSCEKDSITRHGHVYSMRTDTVYTSVRPDTVDIVPLQCELAKDQYAIRVGRGLEL